MRQQVLVLLAILTLSGAGWARSADLEAELDRALLGAWSTLATEVYSSCSGTYSNNTVGPAGVVSKADRSFDAGELVKVDRIKVKRARVDLLVTLANPVLAARTDGPFTLYDELECKAQLIIELPHAMIRSADVDGVLAAIERVLTRYPSRTAAEASATWNGRLRAPYPEGYEQIVAAHERWRAEQNNLAVSAAIEHAVDQAADAAGDMESGDDYLAGFAAGAERLHDLSIGGCSTLVDASFGTWRKKPPSGHSSAWERGFDDGQRLVFHVRLARELHDCFVPPPEAAP